MKYLFALLLITSNIALADECTVRMASQMVSERKVGAIVNLTKDKSANSCTVKFQVEVDNDWHKITWSHSGYYQEEILCQMAIENGMKELMVRLPGKYKTESITVCGERPVPKSVQKGDDGMENEFGKDYRYPNYFKVNNVSKCRKFQNRYIAGRVLVADGVICENKDSFWTVIDKF